MKRFFIPMVLIAFNGYAAGIQKWTDESGNVHYGDTPPVQTKSQTISVTRPPSNPGRALPRFTPDKTEKEVTGTQVEKTKQGRTTDEVNKQACKKARENLEVIARNSLIRLKLSDGSERVLSDEEIDQRRLKLEQNVKQYCN